MQKQRGARLGQHFLIHSWAARTLAHAAAPKRGEVIVEIGPGKGVLTRELLTLGEVLAIEKDEKLTDKLRDTFAQEVENGRLTLLQDDIRNFDPTSYKLKAKSYIVAANIPYYITGEIIRQFLTADVQPRAMALLVQKEVAQRIVDTKESILSISVKAYGTPKIIVKVGKSHFSPPPSVDSAILLIDDISKDFFTDISEEWFFEIVHKGFASKRKMLRGNLGPEYDVTVCGIPETARGEDVSLTQWKCLAHLP